jgi:hypothetical protein
VSQRRIRPEPQTAEELFVTIRDLAAKNNLSPDPDRHATRFVSFKPTLDALDAYRAERATKEYANAVVVGTRGRFRSLTDSRSPRFVATLAKMNEALARSAEWRLAEGLAIDTLAEYGVTWARVVSAWLRLEPEKRPDPVKLLDRAIFLMIVYGQTWFVHTGDALLLLLVSRGGDAKPHLEVPGAPAAPLDLLSGISLTDHVPLHGVLDREVRAWARGLTTDLEYLRRLRLCRLPGCGARTHHPQCRTRGPLYVDLAARHETAPSVACCATHRRAVSRSRLGALRLGRPQYSPSLAVRGV